MGDDKNPGGRPTKPENEKAARRTITLPRRLDDAILLLQQDDEAYSETIARLLNSHPTVQAVRTKGR